jgi:hypothetical protein
VTRRPERSNAANKSAASAPPVVAPPAVAQPNTPDANASPPEAQGAAGPPVKVAFEPAFTWDDPVRLMKSLGIAWREVTDRETPTFLQLVQEPIERVDVDEPTGYVAVHTEGEIHRAIGLRRDAIVPLAAVLTGRLGDEVRKLVGAGPAKIDSLKKPEKTAQKTDPTEKRSKKSAKASALLDDRDDALSESDSDSAEPSEAREAGEERESDLG